MTTTTHASTPSALPLITPDQLHDALMTMKAVIEVIRDAGRVPNGTVYAAMMTKGMSLTAYESMMRQILRTGLVKMEGDMLVWSLPMMD